MGDERFGVERAVSVEGGQIVQWRYTCRRSMRRELQQGGTAPRVRAA